MPPAISVTRNGCCRFIGTSPRRLPISSQFMEAGRQFSRMIGPCAVVALAIVFFLVVATEHTDAHTPVTSKYDYNRDVFPVLRDHCAGCHVPGGTAEGNPDAKLPDVAFPAQWKLGPPDLKIQMDAEHTVATSAIEEVCEFSLAANVTETKWIRAADLMPGAASIVRDAVISIENGPVLALWEPGGQTIAVPSGAAFRLTPGSKIHLQIHYKKHFDQEQNAVSDRSTIGLYFADPPPSGRELQSFAIDPPKAAGGSSGSSISGGGFGGTLPGPARIVALRPMLDRAYESLNIDAITPSGATVPLLRLHGPRPQWFQRYWLQQPVELASGTKITVRLTPLPDYSDEPKAARQFPLQVVLDYVPL